MERRRVRSVRHAPGEQDSVGNVSRMYSPRSRQLCLLQQPNTVTEGSSFTTSSDRMLPRFTTDYTHNFSSKCSVARVSCKRFHAVVLAHGTAAKAFDVLVQKWSKYRHDGDDISLQRQSMWAGGQTHQLDCNDRCAGLDGMHALYWLGNKACWFAVRSWAHRGICGVSGWVGGWLGRWCVGKPRAGASSECHDGEWREGR